MKWPRHIQKLVKRSDVLSRQSVLAFRRSSRLRVQAIKSTARSVQAHDRAVQLLGAAVDLDKKVAAFEKQRARRKK